MRIDRRGFIKAGAAAGALALGAPAIAQSRTKVKLGYLHTLAVDGQIWTGIDRGTFAKHNVEFEPVQFTTGLELFQAMIGGSIEMLATGAVISNFPARGQGRMFLVNNVEFATAQLWVREDMGIKSFADLKGKKISTTTGTTAHVFLDTALRANGIGPGDVELVNQRMSEAVTSFIAGAVPAVALWAPFDSAVRQKVPGARKIVDASAFYPQAAIMGGWAARNDYFEKNRPVLVALIKAWAEANQYIVANPDQAAETLQKLQYQDVPLAEFKEQFKATKYYSNAEWVTRYQDGTAAKWLQQVTDFFVQTAKIENAVPADRYFDPKLFLEAVKP